jgi:mannosyltransferase
MFLGNGADLRVKLICGAGWDPVKPRHGGPLAEAGTRASGALARTICCPVSVTAALPRAVRRDLAGGELLSAPSLLAVGALIVLAAALRFALIGHQGYWFDEGNTVLLVHFSPGKMLGLIPQTEDTPPLYYCVGWVWARIFGFGEAGLRSLSATAGVLVVPALYAAAAKLGSRRAGLIVAALAACNPLLVWYSQEARAYSLLVLMSALSLVALAWLLERPTPRRAGAWGLAVALALATHYYAVLVVAPEALWLLYRQRRSRAVLAAVAFAVVVGGALLPYALGQESTGHANWIAAAPLGRRLGQLIPQFIDGFQLPSNGVLEPLAVAIAGVGVAALLVRGERAERRAGALTGGFALAGLAISLLLVAAGTDDLLTRNLLALWPPAAVALAAGLAGTRPPGLGLVLATGLCALGIAGVVDFDSHRSLQRPDWRPVAAALERPVAGGVLPPRTGAIVPVSASPGHPARTRGSAAAGLGAPIPGGRVIVIQHYRDLLPLSLYLPRLKFLAGGAARVRELDVVSFTSPPSAGFCWWGSACNLWPSRMQASYRIRGFRAVSRTRVLQFTILRMVARRDQTISAGSVAGALRGTTLHEDDVLIER